MAKTKNRCEPLAAGRFDRLAQRNIRARGEQVREPPSLRGKIFYLQAIASSE